MDETVDEYTPDYPINTILHDLRLRRLGPKRFKYAFDEYNALLSHFLEFQNDHGTQFHNYLYEITPRTQLGLANIKPNISATAPNLFAILKYTYQRYHTDISQSLAEFDVLVKLYLYYQSMKRAIQDQSKQIEKPYQQNRKQSYASDNSPRQPKKGGQPKRKDTPIVQPSRNQTRKSSLFQKSPDSVNFDVGVRGSSQMEKKSPENIGTGAETPREYLREVSRKRSDAQTKGMSPVKDHFDLIKAISRQGTASPSPVSEVPLEVKSSKSPQTPNKSRDSPEFQKRKSPFTDQQKGDYSKDNAATIKSPTSSEIVRSQNDKDIGPSTENEERKKTNISDNRDGDQAFRGKEQDDQNGERNKTSMSDHSDNNHKAQERDSLKKVGNVNNVNTDVAQIAPKQVESNVTDQNNSDLSKNVNGAQNAGNVNNGNTDGAQTAPKQEETPTDDQNKSELSKNVNGAQNAKEDLPRASSSDEFQELRTKYDVLVKENDLQKAEINELSTRLSKLVSRQMTDANPSIQDLSDKNRPMKIGEMFSSFYDDEWTDSYEGLQNIYRTDRDILLMLRGFLSSAYGFCQESAVTLLDKLKESMGAVIICPEVKLEGHNETSKIKDDAGMENIVNKAAKDFLKSSGTFLVENLCSIFRKHTIVKSLTTKGRDPDEESLRKILKFVDRAVELTWLMSIQDPPMTLKFARNGETINEDVYSCYEKDGDLIDICVWPALYMCENGELLKKGHVLPI